MHIQRLEIEGFKSFSDKTVLTFDQQICGVVGPNGCGKSNVVDAIKWCLGEQSAKSMRGQVMEDVIFSGSMTRSASSAAEVSIVFNRGEDTFPGLFAHSEVVQVTRRLTRNGSSSYLINQSKVRLQTVIEFAWNISKWKIRLPASRYKAP